MIIIFSPNIGTRKERVKQYYDSGTFIHDITCNKSNGISTSEELILFLDDCKERRIIRSTEDVINYLIRENYIYYNFEGKLFARERKDITGLMYSTNEGVLMITPKGKIELLNLLRNCI